MPWIANLRYRDPELFLETALFFRKYKPILIIIISKFLAELSIRLFQLIRLSQLILSFQTFLLL